jgi:hypothetical protein
MVADQSHLTSPPSTNNAGQKGEPAARQAVAGLMPPQLGEAMIREVWPSVVGYAPGLCGMAAALMRSVVLAPLGWLLLAPVFGRKFSPVICRRYTVTNRRLMIRTGLRPAPKQEVPLADIDDVRVVPESLDAFYRAGDLEVLSRGQVVMKLPGVPEPESFRHSILNAVRAWVPEKAKGPWVPASAKTS